MLRITNLRKNTYCIGQSPEFGVRLLEREKAWEL